MNYTMYQHGKPIGSTDVTWINGIRVAAKYAPFVKALMDAAQAAGVPMILASGFRIMEEQIALRKQNVKDKSKVSDDNYILKADNGLFSPRTAAPGSSDHQNGLAYDFAVMDHPEKFEWLSNHAHEFGFVRTVPSERWHWEYLPDVDKFAGHADLKASHFSWKIPEKDEHGKYKPWATV